jgi:hypothetical protein
VIYAEGAKENVEEFVSNVKSMQWLALKIRFVEPISDSNGDGPCKWVEFQKVGEVVKEMKRLRREEYVLEMGIGNAGTSN